MRSTVVTASRSPQIGGGLTYDAGPHKLTEGDLVQVTLRKKIVEGVIVALDEKAKAEGEKFAIKPIMQRLGNVLPPAQAKLAQWMADEYFCSLRAVLSILLPAPPWKSLLKAGDPGEKGKRAVIRSARPDKSVTSLFTDHRPTVCWMPLRERQDFFLSLAAEALARGRQAIVLYPEVMLAEEAARRFREKFGDSAVALSHSRLSPKERKILWRRVQSGSVRVVVGTRTALFAPCRELGLVIIDDEQEWTYKSEETPRYLARPVAEKLCNFASAKLVLGTAVPSVDVFAKTLSAEYAVVRSPTKARGETRIIDLGDTKFGDFYPFSPLLMRAIAERLQRGEQSLLLFNRRGAGTALICEDCRRRVVSKDGNVPLTVHEDPRGTPFLIDHATGAHAGVPAVCPSCKSPRLKIIGAGTQTVEDILKTMFPAARILRSDSDVASPEETEKMLRMIREKKADILLGTRSILKSMELPTVTLAAVLLSDTGLSIPDFRAGERVFQTLAQLLHLHADRPGSTVIIQTYRPDAPEIALAAKGDDERYLQEEASLRTIMGYPPAVRMVRLLLRGADAKQRADMIAADIKKALPKGAAVSVGTAFNDQRLWHILLRAPDPHAILRQIDLRSAVVDVDPLETA